jgi:hypothetical protein
MDIIFIVFACIYISKRAKEKELNHKQWVWRTIGSCVLFELAGAFLSLGITGGNFLMAAAFGFFCAIGGFLVVKNRLDKIEIKKKNNTDWMTPPNQPE